MKLKIHVPLLFLLLSFFSTALQAQFSVEAEFRPRFEVRDGYRKLAQPAAKPSWIISQRTRFSFNYVTDSFKTLQGVADEGFSSFFFVELTLQPILFSHKTNHTL